MRKLLSVIVIFLLFQIVAYADLLDYVAKEDPNYRWKKVDQEMLPNEVLKIDLELTSQEWQGIVWKHRLRILKPQNTQNPALVSVIITGSESGDEELVYAAAIANGIGAPVAIIFDVPYQPLFNGLIEDDLIAYSFVKTLETGDEEWPLLFPMTKTTVRAMDAVEEYLKQELDIEVSGFAVTGGSKRGWTTWLVAAVDSRVKGIMPVVYDNLDLAKQMAHQLEAWGDYSEQISEYTELNLPQRLAEGSAQRLASIVDPYTYRDRITVPKLIINATNDRYWPLDALNIYYDDLVGEKYILYLPNRGHDAFDIARVLGAGLAFHKKLNGRIEFPELSWDFKKTQDGVELSVNSKFVKPVKVSVWKAESSTRDFRRAAWKESQMTLESSTYKHTLKKPEQGYAAMFGEAVYKAGGMRYFLSTKVYILE